MVKRKYLFIILFIFIFCITGCSKSNSNIKEYLSRDNTIDTKAKDVMPDINELPQYKNIEYRSTHKSMILFDSDSIALIVYYDDETYENEKNKLEKNYTFLNQKIKSEFDESKYYIPENEFSINSYKFKVIDSNGNANIKFPKSFGMIGTSDDKKSIAYLYFYDADLDYIGKNDDESPMADFVKEYFDYDF